MCTIKVLIQNGTLLIANCYVPGSTQWIKYTTVLIHNNEEAAINDYLTDNSMAVIRVLDGRTTNMKYIYIFSKFNIEAFDNFDLINCMKSKEN